MADANAGQAPPSPTVFLSDPDVTLWHGDVRETLAQLEAGSVDCVVTSPPYWGLRDYGTGAWAGGDPVCDHRHETKHQIQGATSARAGRSNVESQRNENFRDKCRKCGATRIDNQLGLEPTPELYIENMVSVFREVWRVLADHGTCWVNMGDAYASVGERKHGGFNGSTPTPQRTKGERLGSPMQLEGSGLKPKDLVGAPWRLAFALQVDGWYLRSDIVWSKPNPMPESVTDRPTKAHEYVFLLAKRLRYFFDQEAVREPSSPNTHSRGNGIGVKNAQTPFGEGIKHNEDYALAINGPVSARNIRSVWEIATQPYPEAHFATFPEELARRCILAGTSEGGKCSGCGLPWIRQIERAEMPEMPKREGKDHPNALSRDMARGGGNGMWKKWREANPDRTTGWLPSCGCVGLDDIFLPSVPCVILDPFVGSGTVPHVARKHGRHAIGIDLNGDYLKLAGKRLQQLSLLSEVNQ